MGFITRQEAAHRFRLIAAIANRGVTSSRDGNWRDAFDAIYELQDSVKSLYPHIEECCDAQVEGTLPGVSTTDDKLVGSLKYGTPPSTPPRKGGMGYSGSAGYRASVKRDPDGNWTREEEPKKPAPPSSDFRAPHRSYVDASSSSSGRDSIIDPLSEMIDEIAKMKHAREHPQPIVTPPPEAEPRIVTFDLRRIPGMTEHALASQQPDTAPLTEEEQEAADLFRKLSGDVRSKVIDRYRSTLAPVKMKVKA